MVTFRNRYIFFSPSDASTKNFNPSLSPPIRRSASCFAKPTATWRTWFESSGSGRTKSRLRGKEKNRSVTDTVAFVHVLILLLFTTTTHHPHPFILFHTPKGGQGCLMPHTLSGISGLPFDSSFPSLLSSST